MHKLHLHKIGEVILVRSNSTIRIDTTTLDYYISDINIMDLVPQEYCKWWMQFVKLFINLTLPLGLRTVLQCHYLNMNLIRINLLFPGNTINIVLTKLCSRLLLSKFMRILLWTPLGLFFRIQRFIAFM